MIKIFVPPGLFWCPLRAVSGLAHENQLHTDIVTGRVTVNDLVLAAANPREFDRVPTLRVEDWTAT